jgi:hypothetical protein
MLNAQGTRGRTLQSTQMPRTFTADGARAMSSSCTRTARPGNMTVPQERTALAKRSAAAHGVVTLHDGIEGSPADAGAPGRREPAGNSNTLRAR